MNTHPYANKLIVAVDDKFFDLTDPDEGWVRANRVLLTACENLAGSGVQLKLNTIARILGYHHAFSLIEKSGLYVMVDMKYADIVDTSLADIRAISGFSCIRRVTFRVETDESFLIGSDSLEGAQSLMPNVSFLPVGPLTDNTDVYYQRRGQDSRASALRKFFADVELFGDSVTEAIMSPVDIKLASRDFMDNHNPITPAVRPVGLKGNERNNANALNVSDAIAAGAKAIIVGSPIMQAPNPLDAVLTILDQIGEAHGMAF